MIKRVAEIISYLLRRDRSREDRPKATWNKGLLSEVKFWDRWLRDGNNPALLFRLDPNSPLQDWLTVYLNKESKVNRILDVGSGPLTNVGKRCDVSELEIVCCDVLAGEYRELLTRHGIETPYEIRQAEGERLTEVFPENRFDIVFSNNAVDHTHDAVRAIMEMIKTAKEGGFVVIQVAENEGRRNAYRGLHQWDCYIDQERFMMKRRYGQEADIESLFKDIAEVTELSYVSTNPCDLPWEGRHIRVVLKKATERHNVPRDTLGIRRS